MGIRLQLQAVLKSCIYDVTLFLSISQLARLFMNLAWCIAVQLAVSWLRCLRAAAAKTDLQSPKLQKADGLQHSEDDELLDACPANLSTSTGIQCWPDPRTI